MQKVDSKPMRYVAITEAGDADVLKLAERARPACEDNQVLIKVAAAGVNRPDIMQRRGLYPAPDDASDIPGLEVAGTIVKVGASASRWKVGEDVCALVNGGGYAEYVNVAEGQCLPVPQGLSLVEAAALPETFFTVWTNIFDRGRLRPGETLLVHGGSSGIGVAAIQMAVATGARVFVTAGTEAKCEACVKLGAEYAVNYRKENFVERLQEVTDGKGVDVILDMIGGNYVSQNIDLAAIEGRIVTIAFQKGAEITANFAPLLLKRLLWTGSTLRPQSAQAKAEMASALREHIWPHFAAGNIVPVIAKTFPLAEAAAAHKLMEEGSHIGKIVLEVESF